MVKKHFFIGAAIFGLTQFLSGVVLAQNSTSYPDESVTLIVPFSAGGPTDTLGRVAADLLSQELNQTFIAENVPGAGGAIGADQVARADPDGYTLVVGTPGSMAVNPQARDDVNYDPMEDFVPVAMIGYTPSVVLVNASSPYETLEDLLQAAKENPGELNYGSAGVGSFSHLSGELFSSAADVEMTHIPYQGTAPSIADLISGNIDLTFGTVQSYLSSDGQLRALALGAGERSELAPNIPTAEEAGLEGYRSTSFTGLFAPDGTPDEVVQTLASALNKGLQREESSQRFENLGVERGSHSPTEFAEFFQGEYQAIGSLIEGTGLTLGN